MQCVIRFSSARRGGVQRRALREAKGDGAAAALRRSWMPVVVSVVLQQSLQGWREAFDDAAKPGRKKRECEVAVGKERVRGTAEPGAARQLLPEGHHEGPLRPRGDGRKRKRAHRPCSDAESAGRQAGADRRRHRPRGTAAASSLFYVLHICLLRLDSLTSYSVAPESKLESELKRARQRRLAMPPGKFTCIRGRVGLSSTKEEPRRRWI